MNFSCISFAILFAVIEWLAVGYSWRKVEHFAKPGVMVFLIMWIVLSGGIQRQLI
jgi:hypothetical protein